MTQRENYLDLIRSNIEDYGYHLYIVNSPTEPRYAYTIGLTQEIGFELIFAGGIFFMKKEVEKIIHLVAQDLIKTRDTNKIQVLNKSLGSFSLKSVDKSWSKLMMIGALDFYKTDKISSFQLIPDASHYTLDIPDMSVSRGEAKDPVWEYLDKDWTLDVPHNSTITTNLDALKGEPITEVTRWEENEWEMFAGSGNDVSEEEARVVPLGTLLGIDSTLYASIKLSIGKGIWRDAEELIWHEWN
ncbi:MAG: DUF4262 domain-containing protein [Bacteroidota bacterium]